MCFLFQTGSPCEITKISQKFFAGCAFAIQFALSMKKEIFKKRMDELSLKLYLEFKNCYPDDAQNNHTLLALSFN